jgi:MerC mercury resistance protein
MAHIQELWAEHIDRIGMITSGLCFIHCIAAPVILSLSAVSSHFIPSEEHTHRLLAVFVTIVGTAAIGFGYRRHKRKRVLGAASLGLALICSGAYFGDLLPSHGSEVAVTLAGSCCMIFAHRVNHTFCKNCKRCPYVFRKRRTPIRPSHMHLPEGEEHEQLAAHWEIPK